jgi:hypothetical protein
VKEVTSNIGFYQELVYISSKIGRNIRVRTIDVRRGKKQRSKGTSECDGHSYLYLQREEPLVEINRAELCWAIRVQN